MKTIKIQKLTMRNFKGCAGLELELDGKNASIYGDNAAGKTTVYDALTWLLFGKDSRGQSNDELIKPLDESGAVKDHEAVTTVEAVLLIGDGRTLTLRKELREVWTTRRGSSQTVYGGNTVDYSVDGVPLQKKGYTAAIEELVSEETFRLLTSVSAFPADLHWAKRRAILADMSGAGDLSDRAMLQAASDELRRQAEDPDPRKAAASAERGERFTALLDDLDGRSLEDEKKILLREQKDLKQAKTQTPARIDELEKQLAGLQLIDFEAARLRLADAQKRGREAREAASAGTGYSAELQARLDALREQEKVLEADRAEESIAAREELAQAVMELNRLGCENRDAGLRHVGEIRRKDYEIRALERENALYRREQEKKLPDLAALRQDVRTAEDDLALLRRRAENLKGEADAYQERIAEDRAQWLQVSQEIFRGGACPTCGRELPVEQLKAAKERFEQEQRARLNQIQKIAESHKQGAEKAGETAKSAQMLTAQAEERLVTAQKALQDAQALPTEIRDMEGYREKMDALEADMKALKAADGSLPGYDEKVKQLQAYIDERKNPKPSAGLQARLEQYEAEAAALNRVRAQEETEAQERIRALQAEVRDAETAVEAARAVLAKESMISALSGRIDELRSEQKQAAAELERVDALLYAIEDFVRWKMRYVEDSVNGLFHIVKFRLFREQANGGVAECCDATVDGVPYAAVNNGARINAGVDIIRRLSEHYGVKVPLFVDNAEAVTRLENAETQVIRLVVSEQDKSLRVEV